MFLPQDVDRLPRELEKEGGQNVIHPELPFA